MSDTIITAIITGGLALIGSFAASYFANNKTKALILYRLDQIERKQDKHNAVIERTYHIEESMAVLDNRVKVSEHRIEDLERGHNG